MPCQMVVLFTEVNERGREHGDSVVVHGGSRVECVTRCQDTPGSPYKLRTRAGRDPGEAKPPRDQVTVGSLKGLER